MVVNFETLGFNAVRDRFRSLAGYDVDETYYVGTSVHYAAYIEFGTSKMQPRPFLRPAVEEVRANLGNYGGRTSNPEDVMQSIALDVESGAKRRCPVDTGNLRGSIRTWQE